MTRKKSPKAEEEIEATAPALNPEYYGKARLDQLVQKYPRIMAEISSDGNIQEVARKVWELALSARLTDAHISLIGHITRDELRRYLDRTELANGFANRFLWIAVRRSKCLPEGGALAAGALDQIRERLEAVIARARQVDRMTFNAEARESWHAVYPALSAERPGLLGAVLSRAEAQTLRLASIYALLDGADEIGRVHLLAALALWEYCEASARWIFGASLGDSVADTILEALRTEFEGMTRTELSGLFQHHQPSEKIDRALANLREQGLIEMESIGTAGRSREVWRFSRGRAAK